MPAESTPIHGWRGGGEAGDPPKLSNFFYITQAPPTQKTLGCSCTQDANPTAIRK